jgi:hypothetical protein
MPRHTEKFPTPSTNALIRRNQIKSLTGNGLSLMSTCGPCTLRDKAWRSCRFGGGDEQHHRVTKDTITKDTPQSLQPSLQVRSVKQTEIQPKIPVRGIMSSQGQVKAKCILVQPDSGLKCRCPKTAILECRVYIAPSVIPSLTPPTNSLNRRHDSLIATDSRTGQLPESLELVLRPRLLEAWVVACVISRVAGILTAALRRHHQDPLPMQFASDYNTL